MLIDAGALDPAHLDQLHNACAQLLRLEQLDDPEALIEHAARLVQLIHTALPQSVREDLAIWLSELLRAAKLDVPVPSILHKESSPMIFDTARRFEEHFTQKGLKLGREEGREEGLKRGKHDMLAKQLQLKFGTDDTRAAWLDALSSDQLDQLAELLLSADDELALRAKLEVSPAPDEAT